jgi:hypothetical protein
MLFKDGEGMPAPTVLENTFDKAFAKQFDEFKKVSAELRATEDGTTYLQYEFTFVTQGEARREIVAAYSHEDRGVLAIAVGAEADFEEHREDIDGMLASASTLP